MIIQILCSGRSLGTVTAEFVGSAIADVTDSSTLEFILSFSVPIQVTLHHTDGSEREITTVATADAHLAQGESGEFVFVPIEGTNKTADLNVSLPDAVAGVDSGYSLTGPNIAAAALAASDQLKTTRQQILDQLPLRTH